MSVEGQVPVNALFSGEPEEEIALADLSRRLRQAADILQEAAFDLAGRIGGDDVSHLMLASHTVNRIAARIPKTDDL
ncbi:hypothetical protein [Thetidibacter halocola]|uniref:Uncharacterized protein n=1 Tax=Thetidibacter halocola TaxID=2827239 RepID=A0A8J8B987_9RHOB|nr:hypothetical protein [Thetidibacter halocola]MBS0126212.1 hypothetical protein [Thetidibacter halocola]